MASARIKTTEKKKGKRESKKIMEELRKKWER